MGFTQSIINLCIHTDTGGDTYVFIGVCVDEIILAGHSDKKIREVKDAVATYKDKGKLHYFLGFRMRDLRALGLVNQPISTVFLRKLECKI